MSNLRKYFKSLILSVKHRYNAIGFGLQYVLNTSCSFFVFVFLHITFCKMRLKQGYHSDGTADNETPYHLVMAR